MYAISVDPDPTPRSAASVLGLHCVHMSQKWDVNHERFNQQCYHKYVPLQSSFSVKMSENKTIVDLD